MEAPAAGRLVAQVAGGLEQYAMKELGALGARNMEVLPGAGVVLFDWSGSVAPLRAMRSVDFVSALLILKHDMPLDASAVPLFEQLPQSATTWDTVMAFWRESMRSETPGLSMREERQARERAREAAVAAAEAAKKAAEGATPSAPSLPEKRPPSPTHAAQDLTEAKKRKDDRKRKKEQKKETKKVGETDWTIGELSPQEASRMWQVKSFTSPSFRVNCDRSGSQQWRSPDVERAVGSGVVLSRGWPVALKNFDLEVHTLCVNATTLISIRLTRDALYERNRWALNLTALRPSVAYAMLRLADVKAGEIVVDPMCGSGTIPIEAADGFKAVAFGGDYSAIGVVKAHYNAERAKCGAQMCLWDAATLPMRSGIADAFVCDMPFGNLCGSAAGNRKMYPRILKEMHRVCTPTGRAVILTQEKNLIRQLVKDSLVWTITAELPILMSGADIIAFRLEKVVLSQPV